MTLLERFIDRFDAKTATLITEAAIEHQNGVHDNRGSEPFRWALLICLGYECLSRFRDSHGIEPTWDDLDAWLQEPEQRQAFADHDGDVDYLMLFVDGYKPYVPERA